MFMQSLRKLAIATCALGSMAITGVHAETYPNKPIKLIIPWVAGGTTDTFARVITGKMSKALGQPFVLEYRPGAGATIGHEVTAKADPDGYTLLVCHIGAMTITPALKKLGYDATKDFALIGQIVSGPTVLVVHPDVPAKSVSELIKHAKANPGKLNYGSVGLGSSTHLAGEMLSMMAGIDMVHVPYKGAPPIVTDMLGGRVALAFMAVTTALPHIRAGSLRAIAVSSLKRFPLLPDLATVSETLPGFELNAWHGLVAPAGTAKPIIGRLHTELAAALKDPEVVQWLAQNGLEPSGTGPEEFARYMRSEIDKWSKIVNEAKVSLN